MGSSLTGRPSLVAQIPLRKHFATLGALTFLHVAVFLHSLQATNGIPTLAIPYDFFNSYARFLIYISDCLRAGTLPIWFPYGHAGTPFFINPQSQIWSPVTWFVSLVFGYNPVVAQRQEFLFILFGSFGAYFLSYSLWARRSAALLTAIAYNFTSARLCNAQHMDIVTACSILPWIFLGIRKLAQGHRLACPLLGAAVGLLVVSGYPGVVLLSPLWFGAWTLWCLATECATWASRRRFMLGLALSLAIGLGVSAGHWLPIAANRDVFTRSEPMTAAAALTQGLTPGDFWHLLYGVSTRLPPDSFATDISMRGLYFGIVALALALYAVVFRRDRMTAALAIGALAALVMSMGRHSFVRVALHEWFSTLNLSRFPTADSRAVAVLAGCLLAGGGLAHLRDNPEGRRKLVRILAGLMVLMVVGQLWLRYSIYPSATPGSVIVYFTNPVHIELFVLGVALVAVLRCVRDRALLSALVLCAAFDSGMHVSTDDSLFAVPLNAEVQHLLDIHSKDFDPAKALLPRISAATLDDGAANDAYFDKKFYLASYTPFQLKRLHHLVSRGFKPFFVSGARVVGFRDSPPPLDGAVFQKTMLPVTFKIASYLPSRVDYVVDLPARTTLVFNEIYFPGWRARIDGGEARPMLDLAGGLRGLEVEAGHHIIATRFLPASFLAGLEITMLSWLGVVAWLAYALWRRWRPSLPRLLGRLPAA